MAKILIADDSPTAAALLQRMLAPLGHTILTVSDGEEAVRRIQHEHPDLVIVDIIMPKMNGFQLCRTIRSDPELKDLPIIVVTSMDRESDRYWGMKQGADEYLVKPVEATVLQDKVRHYLQSVV
jgi:twitching motility two-component system response regulator PilH